MRLPKQKNSYQSDLTFLCFESFTPLFASQHNLFRSMWPADDAKGLFRFKGRPILKLLAWSIIRSLNCTPFGPITVTTFIIWLALRTGKINQIARCDWLPERVRWSHLARSGLSAVSRKQNFTKSHIINPLLTKFVRSRWLGIGLVLFLRVYIPRLRLGP